MRRSAVVAFMALAVSVLTPATATASTTLADSGAWSAPFPVPIVPIHAALTPSGDVQMFGTPTGGASLVYEIWDPETSVYTEYPITVTAELFCSVQVIEPHIDGMLTLGGDLPDPGNQSTDIATLHVDGVGISPQPSLSTARWYATANVLPDGDIFVHGGRDEDTAAVLMPEVFNIDTGWRTLDGATSWPAYGPEARWWYPRSWVAPDGSIFTISGSQMYTIDPSGTGSITFHPAFPGTNIGTTSTAVMFEPGRILQVSGGGFGTSSSFVASAEATIVDITGGAPVLTAATPIPQALHWANSTVLPTGDVLVTGGSTVNNTATDVNYAAYLWEPDTDTWTTLADAAHMRLYHSTAMLLPDGRVFSGGGGLPGPVIQLNGETFSPPYLFDGDNPAVRPTIVSAPSTLEYGSTFEIEVSSDATRFTLVGASAVTHSFNMTQRFMELTATGSGNTRTLTAPASANDAPPGLYQLFALDADGTPSEAALVSFDPAPGNPIDGIIDLGGFDDGDPVATPPGFEEITAGGSFGAWYADGDVTRDDAGLHPGSDIVGAALDLQDDGAVRRFVSGLVPGASYELTFGAALHPAIGASDASARVEIDGVSIDVDPDGDTTAALEPHSIVFTATARTVPIRFEATGSSDPDNGVIVDSPALRPAGTPVITAAGVGGIEGDIGTSDIAMTLSLDRVHAAEVTVDWSVLDVPGVPTVAVPGIDVTDAAGTATFVPGQTETTITLEIIGDTDSEPPLLWGEWALIDFQDPTGGTVIDPNMFFGLGIVVIIDDDPPA
ncbi:MAG: galactose oxidase-like domain-containing protein [Actinomycetota bacterium]